MKLKVQNSSSTPNIHIHCVIFILVVSIPRITLRTKDTKIVKQHKAKSTEFFFSTSNTIRYHVTSILHIHLYTYFFYYYHTLVFPSNNLRATFYFFFLINVENYNQLCNYRGLISLSAIVNGVVNRYRATEYVFAYTRP